MKPDRRPSRQPHAGEPSLGPLGVVALLVVLIVIGALLLRPHASWPPRGATPRLSASDRVLLDSLKVADARKDWPATLRWAERLGERFPREHTILLARGTAWSNYAIAGRPGRAVLRPALRTSLERIACLRRSLFLTDSAGILAPDAATWVDAMRHLGQLEETMGLSGDALIAYESIKQRQPGEWYASARAYWLRALLYDPVHPDTSEWDRQMRRHGRG